MFRSLQVISVILVAVAMALALAHALELPGKMRLSKETYVAVQPIYYPGFTIGGGIGEGGGMIALLALLFFTPYASTRFWWTLVAFVLLLAMHLAYWVVTHPVNNFWLKETELTGAGAAFFSLFSSAAAESGADWSKLRAVWEYSHVARAVLAMLSLVSLLIAVTAHPKP
jgi:hypothetical protein